MAEIRMGSPLLADNSAYYLVRRAQASIASYRHFRSGDLARYLERESFTRVAERLTDHYFHRSTGLAIQQQVIEIYKLLLIMAPLLQRLPLSAKFDWHRGHLTGWFRRNCNGRSRRFYFGTREINRSYEPDLLAANLEAFGLHDAPMVMVLLDIYRRHAGGTALKDLLTHQLFDPILMLNMREGYELRWGNRFYRLEKTPFEGSIDLRNDSAVLLDYRIRSLRHQNGHHLEIGISEECLTEFREAVVQILAITSAPGLKMRLLEDRIRDLVELTRPARSALPQVKELKQWLAAKLKPLAGTVVEANRLPHLLINLWLQRADSRLHLKSPSVFFTPSKHDEKTFTSFLSPYREV